MEKDINRKCSLCGEIGHNSRTCHVKEVRLFGVQLTDAVMSTCSVSHHINSQPERSESGSAADGYISEGIGKPWHIVRDRKKGIPWTKEEHRLFLLGLNKLGKGDWRGISRTFVTTRTPTQVASHAQKYFLRQEKLNKRRRCSSLFDIPAECPVVSLPSVQEPIQPINPKLSLDLNSSFIGILSYDMPAHVPISPIFPVQLGDNFWHKDPDLVQYENDRNLRTWISNSPNVSVLENSGVIGSVADSSLSLTLSLWPGSETENYMASFKSQNPTTTVPSALTRTNESREVSDLTLSIAPPSIERDSLFQGNPSVGSGSYRSVISVA